MNLAMLLTETQNPATSDIDELPTLELVTRINDEDRRAPEAVRERLPEIAALIDAITAALLHGGRLVYVGAGTSGRLGVLDASECPPTYGTDPSLVVGLIAGGEGALRHGVEDAEDGVALGVADVQAIGLNARDVLVGIAASGRTPYTLAAMEHARAIGATVGCIVNSPDSPMAQVAQHPIVILAGPEVVTGSTRMKSGTTQKLVLNMLSTGAMIRLGKVYGNLMVDVQPTNRKLVQRALDIVVAATGVSVEEARQALATYGGAKAAICGLLTGLDGERVATLLARHHGHLKNALAAVSVSAHQSE
jgi:N-acetylmuramic acid 6-phosphate etherase